MGRVLFSQDVDLLAEATRRQRAGISFQGIVYAPQLAVSIGQCIDDLDLLAKAGSESDLLNRVCYLPLR